MLTLEQKIKFCLAISDCDNLEDCWIQPEQIVETKETIENFFESIGRNRKFRTAEQFKASENDYTKDRGWNTTKHGNYYRWENVKNENGEKIRDVYLMDFGNVRAAYSR